MVSGRVVGAGRPHASGFRPDIDGLRAVAILVVVAYHAGVPGFDGGFVGVDVFFVISGFLITRQLLAEADRTGRVGLVAFWARRIRRLVPALAAMVVTVVGLSFVVLPALGIGRVVDDARWSLLYVSNIAFARQANDYFTNDLDPSVLLHTWSLGVEEQFYVVWPLLVLVVLLAARRRPERRRPVLAVGFGMAGLASFLWCLSLSSSDPASAFFLLPSRAWEFAVAALLACLPLDRLPAPGARVALAATGVVAILGATNLMGDVAVYPGAWPLVPVLGTAALIAAGAHRPDAVGDAPLVTRALGREGSQWLGRLSYSWYLWHWPLIVLGVEVLDDDTTGVKVALAVGSLGVAWVAHRLVENPVRFSPRLRASAPRSYGLALAVTVVALLGVGAVGWAAEREVQSGPLAGLADVREGQREFECARRTTTPSGIEYCEDGALGAARSVLLVGDSHTRHWKPAFAAAAEQEGIRLLVRWRPACPSVAAPTVQLGGGGPDTECDDFRADTARLVEELAPDAVVRSDSHHYSGLITTPDGRTAAEVWRDELVRGTEKLREAGIRTGLVADSPSLPFDPVDCLAEEGDGPACELTREQAFERKEELLAVERQVAAADDQLKVFDITDTFCDASTCPLVIDHTYVYIDKDHLTEPFVLTQVDEVRAYLRGLMAGSG